MSVGDAFMKKDDKALVLVLGAVVLLAVFGGGVGAQSGLGVDAFLSGLSSLELTLVKWGAGVLGLVLFMGIFFGKN